MELFNAPQRLGSFIGSTSGLQWPAVWALPRLGEGDVQTGHLGETHTQASW